MRDILTSASLSISFGGYLVENGILKQVGPSSYRIVASHDGSRRCVKYALLGVCSTIKKTCQRAGASLYSMKVIFQHITIVLDLTLLI